MGAVASSGYGDSGMRSRNPGQSTHHMSSCMGIMFPTSLGQISGKWVYGELTCTFRRYFSKELGTQRHTRRPKFLGSFGPFKRQITVYPHTHTLQVRKLLSITLGLYVLGG